jgi:acetyl-CoA carboxylase biotin carboxyl carrier protein
MSKMNVDIAQIRDIIKLVKDTGINEIEISQGEMSVRIRRDAPAVLGVQAPVEMVAAAQAAPSQPVAQQPAAAPKADGHVITSPMVGTFYMQPSPDAKPYVKTGDKVKKGQTICIIEAMKTMNQIEADKDGVVQEIMVDNAQPVEFGEPLFRIA